MRNVYDIIIQLTSSQHLPESDRRRILQMFAYEFGWKPSDVLEAPGTENIASSHLIIEHGLEQAAVITFLHDSRPYSDLTFHEKNQILTISYNNLIDWHIQVEREKVIFVFNRTKSPTVVADRPLSRDDTDNLRSEAFEAILGRRPNPNIPALDDALIETISFWKRALVAETEYSASNEEISTLFNSLIFVRAIEDHNRRIGKVSSRTLLETWNSPSDALSLRDIILRVSRAFIKDNIPSYLIDAQKLQVFDSLDRRTVHALLSDFYRNKYAPYEYDFSLISKHALSRIYEQYVSILRLHDSPQLPLPGVAPMPKEERDKSYGSIYTPQYIARFFARYLREQMPPSAFRNARAADPACGSGIFLRSLLEFQCDPLQNGLTPESVKNAFDNMFGLDVDKNACQATRLSLALLHLVLTDRLPQHLDIISAEAIDYFQKHEELKESFDVVMANPPFVSFDSQNPDMRQKLSEFMAGFARGRIDTYLAFLKIGLELLKPGGYGLFVLPHSFLIGQSAREMRQLIAETTWITCLADLSAIRVFDSSGIYIVLLIFQKRLDYINQNPPALVIKCQDLVGRALQDAVEGRRVESSMYSIYDVEQEAFQDIEWNILPAAEAAMQTKFRTLPVLSDFMEVRQGFVSGADDIFLVPKYSIPENEQSIYVPVLRDREMQIYTVPDEVEVFFFYPYLQGEKISEAQLKNDFPHTWNYLLSNKDKLSKRKSLTRYGRAWWEPMWPRPPQNLMRPKIVTPHLVLVPKFSIDLTGKFAVSRAPILYPRQAGAELDLLRYFVGVLNSSPCFWFISAHSHKYRGGYTMLEKKTLANTPVPDPSRVSPNLLRQFIDAVERRLEAQGTTAINIEKEIDSMASEFYGLTTSQRKALGME